ncbi:phosphate/phosphite/phosphonate ABC transporter substrate-binding protein [Luteimonas sp. SDU82]|uniref:phosphate/phosphite/phosphonate ABC transporter substrate-binding protein n=1 Tax=Luteimonas sp. SDU82 TaxID=3422592 RepID=UPI003EBF16A6
MRLRSCLLSCLLALAPGAALPVEPPPLVVGSYEYPGRGRAAAIAPLAEFLARRSGRAVQLRLWPSPSALVAGFRAGEADVIVPNLHAFLQARGQAAVLPVPDVPLAQADRYRSVLVGRDVTRLEDLARRAKGLRLALVSTDSATGGFVPLARLRALGLEQDRFAAVVHAGSHEAVLARLREGEADVAGLAADIYDASPPDGVHELWRSDPLPPGPLLCRRTAGLPCNDIAAWLLGAHVDAPEVMRALRAGWPEFGEAERFVDAGDVLARLPGETP